MTYSLSKLLDNHDVGGPSPPSSPSPSRDKNWSRITRSDSQSFDSLLDDTFPRKSTLDGEVRAPTVLDLQAWRGDGNMSGIEAEKKIERRRTMLWRMALTMEASTDLSTFAVPTSRRTRSSQFKLVPRLGQEHSSKWVLPLQQMHVSPFAIPCEIADLPCHSMSVTKLLASLNDIFGTRVPPSRHLESFLKKFIKDKWDLGQAYGYLRPWWVRSSDWGENRRQMKTRREQDSLMRREAVSGHRIINPKLPPRRVWDLYSNRVLPFSTLPSQNVPENLWAISHSWVEPKARYLVETPVNSHQWRVPIPLGTTLNHIRIELLNMGAEYVFLDVLCLRQEDGDAENERKRRDEWKVDVPTIGHVYRHDPFQTTIVYFNGLGFPFNPTHTCLSTDLHWFNRAWTLQETTANWLPGGLSAQLKEGLEGGHFAKYMKQALAVMRMEHANYVQLLTAMRNRIGFASKKPYDRVAALAYLLPYPTRPIYDESWSTAEAAWNDLISNMSDCDRTDLLFCYSQPVKSFPKWRPSWAQIMSDGMHFKRHTDPYHHREMLRPWNGSDPTSGESPPFYCHHAFVIERCYRHKQGVTIVRQDTHKSTWKFRIQSRVPEKGEFALIGVSKLPYWVVGRVVERKIVEGEEVIDVEKLTMASMYGQNPERDWQTLKSWGLGSYKKVIYKNR